MSMNDQDRAEIEEDLRAQGLDYAVTPDDVAATFGLHQSVTIPDDDASPSPAFGPDWRYSPEPGEEDLFRDASGMYLPPSADRRVGIEPSGQLPEEEQ